MQQPETGSAAGRKSSWSSSAGQGRAHITVPWARGDAQGRWQSPTRSGQGTAKLQQSQALGRWLWRWQNQTLGAGLGEAPAPGRSWEGEGCQLPPRVPWAPILGLPAARTGSLVPWGAPLHLWCSPDPRVFPCIPVPCTSGSFLHLGLSQALRSSHGRISRASLSLQSRHSKAGSHPVVAQCPHHPGDPGSATQCRGLADVDPSPPTNPCPRLPCR